MKNRKKSKPLTMIVGVDSSHPGVGDRMSKSVSSCVASYDRNFVKYYATTRLQTKVQDLSKELHEMMFDLLKEFVGFYGHFVFLLAVLDIHIVLIQYHQVGKRGGIFHA